MRRKDKGDEYAERALNAYYDEEDSYETTRGLFNEALAEGRKTGVEEAIALCAAKKQAYQDQQDRASHWAIQDLEAELLEAKT